jgi:hypothetical protein
MNFCERCGTLYEITRAQKHAATPAKQAGGKPRAASASKSDDEDGATSNDERSSDDESSASDSSSSDSESESEASDSDSDSGPIVRKRVRADYADIIRMILEGDSKRYDAIEISDYNERDLTRHSDFQRLDTELRERVLGAIQHMLPASEKKGKKSAVGATGRLMHFCNNCGFQKHVAAGTVIFEQSKTVNRSELGIDVELYSSMADDPTLPRTRNYTCPKKNCASHKDTKLREKVTIRKSTTSYHTVSVCCACRTVWQ